MLKLPHVKIRHLYFHTSFVFAVVKLFHAVLFLEFESIQTIRTVSSKIICASICNCLYYYGLQFHLRCSGGPTCDSHYRYSASQNWILINLKPMSATYKNQSINLNRGSHRRCSLKNVFVYIIEESGNLRKL